jgi:hypothetical protein
MRQPLKTISVKPKKFVPTRYREDGTLSEAAPEISNRPLWFLYKTLSREDRYNIQSLGGFETSQEAEGSSVSLTKMGDVAKYIWDNCVIEVHNVLLEDQALEVVVGKDKDRLWFTEGMDEDFIELIVQIQRESTFTEGEAKN